MVIIGNGANSGSVVGRYGVPVLIDAATVAGQAADYNTKTWAAGAYRSLRLIMEQTAMTSSSGWDTITLVGLSGTWTCRQWLVTTALAENSFGRASIKVGWNGTAQAAGVWDFYIPAAPKLKWFKASTTLTDSNTSEEQSGAHSDVTNEVTGLTFVKAGAGTWDFNFELWGIPA